ncbi:transketolase family protein [Paenibacillus sp.]|uniref:transketolase family protein n=1 Tax=Paenibacillus sp. TaxID=58172 RepID=UPI002D3AD0F1|nr:transketolase C-terminal domain-containing protein [Paenibacillus sp.]HZG58104.1 transketolase C-terminal domain-containing protein [Paenibacillus sp.]
MKEEKMYGSSLRGMRSAFKEALLELGARNDKVVVLDCETGTATNILAFKSRYPDRFVSLGVAEQNAISFAFGISRSGYVPIVPLFSAFIARRACDQLFVQAGYPEANVKLIGCYSGLTTPNTGATHQSINDLAIIRSIPNIVVLEACDELELKMALFAAVEYEGPVYLRMVRGDIAPYDLAPVVPDTYRFRIGKAIKLREGRDITLIGSGMMVTRCLEAAERLKSIGISAEVVNCSSIKPLDRETLVASVQKTGLAVTAENHTVIGGMGSAIAELFTEECPVPMKRVGILDRFGESAPLEELFPHYGLTSDAVMEAALDLLARRKQLA